MSVEVTAHGHVTIVEFQPLLPHNTFGELAVTVRGLVQDGRTKILIDLGNVWLPTTLLIGDIVGAHNHACEFGVPIYLCNVGKRVETTLVTTKLIEVMSILRSRAEALPFLGGLDLQLAPGCFEFHSPRMKDLTASLSYLWPCGGTPLNVSHGATPSSGQATVCIVDADGTAIFTRDAANPGSFGDVTGKTGDWRVDLELVEYSGKLDLEIRAV